ncbi:hypothetical protein ARALYDRAFT_898967 [Arabidopsis lyrata subsp. lyrata]|uniref:Arabidopsis retrotransposon Orf1 C-terminal domain-containing protein n=1 Tax=Arabidopsis lyrata subsp. lyrata TaxID=81972 RepID=D7L492_ARALL|nr:hypothetical protein ARALYDRAFT_898967 [Arabidopsis lyrata subsp. lyrata]
MRPLGTLRRNLHRASSDRWEQEQVLPPTTKRKRKAQEKPSKTRTEPQASSSKAPPKNRNDKEKVVEPSDLEDESENEETPSTSPKKTIKKKAPTKPPTSSQRLTKLKSIPFAPTRYPDHGFLQEARLLEDVQDIFTNLGLGQFFTRAYPTYVNPTREFLASLKVQFYDAREARANNDLGYFEFRVGGTLHKMTFKELGDIYNFQAGDELEFSGCSGEYLSFWGQIGTGILKKGATKASTIAHPAIRYAHIVLSHTLFARRETGNVLKEELICLLAGLQPILKELTPGKPIRTSARNTCVAAVFVRQLLHYQEWAWTTTDSTPVLSMGGLVTPILEAKGIALTNIDHEIVRIDPIYLKRRLFLAGRTERNLYVYQGRCSTSRMSAKVLLPNVPITSLRIDGNHHFYVSDVHHYDVARDGVLIAIRKGRRGEIPETSSPPHPPSPVYGQARYDFKPYDEAIADKALREAHTHIHLLQKFVMARENDKEAC